MKFSDDIQIPEWILQHLRRYGNCCCGREIVKRIGKERIIEVLKVHGFDCELKIVYEDNYHVKRKTKYPVFAYYILEVETKIITYQL